MEESIDRWLCGSRAAIGDWLILMRPVPLIENTGADPICRNEQGVIVSIVIR